MELRFITLLKQGKHVVGNLVKGKQIIANGVTESIAKDIIKWYNSYMKGKKKWERKYLK